MAFIDLGLLTASTQRTDRVSTLESTDVFQFSLPGSQDVVFSLGADLGWTVRDQNGAIVAEPGADDRGGEIALTNLDGGILYSLEVRRTDQDLDYTLAIAPGGRGSIDPLTGERAADAADGVFIVGANGQLEFDYSLDGGRYQGEAGIVSLRDLEDLTWGSADWTREIIDRVLSNSVLGHRLVNDRVDNPWIDLFHNEAGEYRGSQILEMTPGDTVAIVLIPNGTFAEVLVNPEIGGDKRPLFSIATANPDDNFYFGQIAVAARDIYVMEDKRIDLGSDRDYNDFGFRLTGVTPRGIGAIDELIRIAPGQDDWRTLVPRWDNVAPIVEFDVTGLDRREFPLSGTVSDGNGAWDIDGLTAEVVDGSGAVVRTIAIDLTPSGEGQTFSIDRGVITDGLEAGDYRLTLTPHDRRNAGAAIVAIELVIPSSNVTIDPDPDPADPNPTNTAPAAPILEALPTSQTYGTTLTLSGQVTDADGWADIDRIVIDLLDPAGQSVQTTTIDTLTASDDDTARFSVEIALAATSAAGRYSLRVTAIDAAGDSGIGFSETFRITVPGQTDPLIDTPDPVIQRPNLLDFSIYPLYTTDETVKFTNAITADPDGWDNMSQVDFWLVREDGGEGEIIDIAQNVTEFKPGGDGSARFGFEFELTGLTPGHYQLVGRAYDQDVDGSLGGSIQTSRSFFVLSGDDTISDNMTSESASGLSNAARFALAADADLTRYDDEILKETDTWIVALNPDVDPSAIAAAAGVIDLGASSIPNGRIWTFETQPSDPVSQLQGIGSIELFYPDVSITLNKFGFTPNPGEHRYNKLPAFLREELEAMWSLATGKGVTIAVNDDGADLKHQEFDKQDRIRANLNRDLTVGLAAPVDTDVSPLDTFLVEFDLSPEARWQPEGFVAPSQGGAVYPIPVNAIGQALAVSVNLNLVDREGLSDNEIAALEEMWVSLHLPHVQNTLNSPKIWNNAGIWSAWRPRWGDPSDVPSSFDFGLDGVWSSEGSNGTITIVDAYDVSSSHAEIGGLWALNFNLDAAPLGAPFEPYVNDANQFYALLEKAIESVELEIEYADSHGTAVLSLVGGGNTGRGVIGTAPESQLVVTRVLGPADPITLSHEQSRSILGLSLFDADRHDQIDLQVNSFGLRPMVSSGDAIQSLVKAAEAGVIQVMAAGNDRQVHPGAGNVNHYSLASQRQVISVGAVTMNQEGDIRSAPYSNPGAFVSAYSGAPPEEDVRYWAAAPRRELGNLREGTYFNTASGTSMSAPFVAGVIAAMQEASSVDLTVRDAQRLLVATSRPVEAATAMATPNDLNYAAERFGLAGLSSAMLMTNAANVQFSYQNGFGVIDPDEAVKQAKQFEGSFKEVSVATGLVNVVNKTLGESEGGGLRPMVLKAALDEDVTAEWVELSLNHLKHGSWNELTVVLESPEKTPVVLKRALEATDRFTLPDMVPAGKSWVFNTPYFWGESALGDWTVRIYDERNNDVTGSLESWELKVFGTQPEVSVVALDGSASEAGDGAMIAIERSGDISKPLTVELDWDNGQEAMLADGSPLPSSVVLAAGQETVLIPIVAKHDYLTEGEESVGLTLVDSSDYFATGGKATITIADSTTTSRYEDFLYEYDGHFYLLSEADTWHGAQAQAEALGGNLVAVNSAEENAWLVEQFGKSVMWVGLTDSEYYSAKEGEFTWTNGETLGYKNWYPGQPDEAFAGEDFVELNSNGGFGEWADTGSNWQQIPGIIEIDPSQLETSIVNVMVTDAAVDEAGHAGQILIQRVGDLSQPLTVKLSQDGTATNGVDYQEIPDTVTIAAGESLAIVPVIGIFDGKSEAEEVVTVSIGKSADYRSGAYGTGQVTIGDRDSDFTPTIITNPDTGKRYFATPTDTWLGSEETAKQYGGHLVTVDNAAENQWLIDTFGSGSYWIGYTDSPVIGATEGKFQWVDGQTSTYSAWLEGYPDNNRSTTGVEGEDFTHLYTIGERVGWNDHSTDRLMVGLVELDDTAPSIVVEPIQEWARQVGSTGYEIGESVAVDNAGNVFLAGWIAGDINGHTYQGRDAAAGAVGDTYLARYDRDGNQLWQRAIGTDGDDAFYGVTTDAEGNAYAVGATNRAIGGATNFGSSDGVIVKYDTSGNIAWTKQIGTNAFDRFWDVQTDSAGNFYAIGSTTGLLDGDRTHAGYDALIVQFDADGNIGWTRQLTSTANSNTEGLHAAIDPTTGDILITGQVGGTLDGETSAGGRDIFVARYSSTGDRLWNMQFGSSVDDAAQAIDVADDGMIYVAGTTYGVLPGETAGGNRDVVVAKLNKDGNLVWTDQFSVEGVGGGRDSDDYAYGLVVDGNQLLVSGHVGGSLDGNPVAGQIDAFLATYDSQGRRGESLQFGFPGWDSLKELVTDGSGTIYAAGSISGALPDQTAAGSIDLMLTKFTRSQEYVSGEALALTDIGVNDNGELVTATLTLSDAAAGTLATTVANGARVEFSGGRLTVAGSPDEVNAVLVGVEFTAALGYDKDVTIATGVSDGFNAAIGETISLSMNNDGLRLDPVDYAALRALYESTDGENWTNNTGWSDWDFSSEVPPLVSIVEDWYGVDTDMNNVTTIDLYYNSLRGEIPVELGSLSELVTLSLYTNDLSGKIPAELGNLSNLSILHLNNNSLTGEIPTELGNLSNLSELSLFLNNLTGKIPTNLGNLSNLFNLDLWSNNLSGEIPAELGNLPKLSILNLGKNNLSGEIPDELGNLSNLFDLSLGKNALNGEIPATLGSLSKLSFLRLGSSGLSGAIPAELGNLSNLAELYLHENSLSGEIPASFANLSKLSYLSLYENSLNGEIPIELMSLDNLQSLYLQNNNLSGFIPSGLINPPTIEMPSLVNIDLSGNNFWNPSLTVTNTNDTGAGSLRAAIQLANTTPGTDPIVFNIPTSDPGYNVTTGAFTIQPLSALPTITDSIVIDGTSQTGYSDRPLIELDGSNAGAGVDGLLLTASDSIIRGLAVNRFGDEGIQAQGDNNTFSNNFLGTDVTGTIDLGNTEVGLFISGGDVNLVENNLISGNAAGFQTRGTNGIIRGNLIGTDVTGTVDLGNSGNGVSIDTGASGNLFGGTTVADRNIVAGNDFHGILIDGSNNRIQGNYIGVDITGENALANDRQGIRLSAASSGSGNLIGGTETGAGNVIANGDRGIVVYADNTTIQGNLIGTDATGTRNFGSNSQAIRVEANGAIIGGSSESARNVISGSKTAQGIMLIGNNTTIQGNYIGTDITGMQAIPNAQSGVYIFEPSTNNLIGGTESGEGNTIANNNGGIGVQGITSINNTIAGNSLFSNNGVGISFFESANANRLAPTLTTAIRLDNQTRIAGNLTAPANTTVRVEFFSDDAAEGRQYLGASDVTTNGAGNVAFDVTLNQSATGKNITATVTDATGNTSKLSSPRSLT